MSTQAQYTLHFVGWVKEGTSDKVWGYFSLPSNTKVYYTFWGRRGARLTFKKYDDAWAHITVSDLAQKKAKEGYVECQISKIEQETPGFTDDFERNFVMRRIMNAFHGKSA